jgi:hypothetical protein
LGVYALHHLNLEFQPEEVQGQSSPRTAASVPPS